MKLRSLIFAGALLFACRALNAQTLSAAPAAAQPGVATFHNDFYWVDQNGERILTRSGCLAKFNGVYYWYGGNPRGFREQYCYSSTDLMHWTNRGIVLQHDVDANRIEVLYNSTTKQYIMFLKYDGNGAHYALATADKPEGPFAFKGQQLIDDALMGDMSVFQDTDGKAYLCYVSWAVGTNAQHGIYSLSPDYMSLDKRLQLWDIRSREAPHVFKRNGIYYYGTSRTAGIQSSGTSYYTATSMEGPWSPPKPLSTPGSTNSWDSQVDFVFPFEGTQGTVYMYVGDRWIKNAETGRNGDYIFLPLEFDGDTPVLNYRQDWELDPVAGTWRDFDPARNLALGKPATASSEETTATARNVTAKKTFENYVGMPWQSAASDPQWVSVDLGAATEINRVVLKWNVNAAKEFKIQASVDGTDWKDVYASTQGSSSMVTDVKFDTTTARYVRMLGVTRAPRPAARGRRGGRGAAQPAPVPTPAPIETGYSMFDFMVMKD